MFLQSSKVTDDPVNEKGQAGIDEKPPILPLGNWMWRQARKLIVTVIGSTVLLIGIIMIAAPGPAFVVIPAGLAILATEFVWAKRLLNYAKRQIQQMTDRAASKSKSTKPPDDSRSSN